MNPDLTPFVILALSAASLALAVALTSLIVRHRALKRALRRVRRERDEIRDQFFTASTRRAA